ncbi:hypothetical protein M408DRAFT_267502 [Serendipita vermifera MAFF 305830]|uniref:Uncharacterized protein n=1 Tax=Serendipita vermifera MAFF 305830 TaxID=933852 RepID=A0A0C3AV61_SERVB|nr:hypothetical protein M408DRAFT_267502 [Serendipita vermifera MAFF 305830]
MRSSAKKPDQRKGTPKGAVRGSTGAPSASAKKSQKIREKSSPPPPEPNLLPNPKERPIVGIAPIVLDTIWSRSHCS